MQQLSKLLHHACENVPYYRRVFDEQGLKPKDIQDFKELRVYDSKTKGWKGFHRIRDICRRLRNLGNLFVKEIYIVYLTERDSPNYQG